MGVYRQPPRAHPNAGVRTLSWRQPGLGPGDEYLGETYQGLSTIYSGTAFALPQGAVPPLLPGDTLIVDPYTNQYGDYPGVPEYKLNPRDDGTVQVLDYGDTQRLPFNWYVFRRITGTFDGPGTVWINEVAPTWANPVINLQMFVGQSMATLYLASAAYATSVFGDTLRFALVSGSLPPGITLSSAGVLSGTPTLDGAYNFVISATDITGTSTNSGLSTMGVADAAAASSTIPDNIRVRTPKLRATRAVRVPDWQSLSRSEAQKVQRIDRKLREARTVREEPPQIEEAPPAVAAAAAPQPLAPLQLGHLPHTDDQDIARILGEEHQQLMLLGHHVLRTLQ